MSKAIEKLQAAQQRATAGRPKVGGFPYLAETLRRAGVTRNRWILPSCQSLYLTEDGPVVIQSAPLVSGTVDVSPFNRDALITALRTDQAGKSTFSEFLEACWRAGVIGYDVDFTTLKVGVTGVMKRSMSKTISLLRCNNLEPLQIRALIYLVAHAFSSRFS